MLDDELLMRWYYETVLLLAFVLHVEDHLIESENSVPRRA